MRIPLQNSITIRLSDPQFSLVKQMAHRHNISQAEAIRVCIDHYQLIEANRDEKRTERLQTGPNGRGKRIDS